MAMQLSDVVMAGLVLIVAIGLAPVMYAFVGEIRPEMGILSRTILSMIVPLLFVMIILGSGVASRGGA